MYWCHVIIIEDELWTSLKTTADEQHSLLEALLDELKNYRRMYEQLDSWLGQKEKMLGLIGPVTLFEPSVVSHQLQQAQVCPN